METSCACSQTLGNELHLDSLLNRRAWAGDLLHSNRMGARRFAIAAILAICMGGPIVEMFDQWDHTPQDGNDTEANVVVAALCAGVAFAIGTIVVITAIRAFAFGSSVRAVAARRFALALDSFGVPGPTGSPPTPLRV